ncbi:MAG: hypothetical protein E7Z62_08080 [Thermoplasmata archaeon]|nr:hypothetical protein [Thermoplasmata archaeon]
MEENMSEQEVIKLIPSIYEGGSTYYPEFTPDLYKLLKVEFPEIKVELSEDIPTISIHDADVILPLLEIGSSIITNIGAGMLANFLTEYLRSKTRKGEEGTTVCELRIKVDGDDKEIQYKGPVSGLSKLDEMLSELK